MTNAEIKKRLSTINIDNIKLKSSIGDRNINGVYMYNYTDLVNSRAAINAVANIPSLEYVSEELQKTAIFKTLGDSLSVPSETHYQIDALSNRLYSYAFGLEHFLDETAKDEDENSIKIKLPPVNDFDDIARAMNDLKRAIAIPVSETGVGGQILIESVESGSIWLLVYLGAQKALRLVAEISWSAVVILNKKRENDFVKQQIRDYELNNEMKENIINAQKQALEKLIEGEATHIQGSYNDDQSNEQTQRLILAINTTMDLLERGAEIRPSLSAKEEIANLFPDGKEPKLIESKIKRLPEGQEKQQATD